MFEYSTTIIYNYTLPDSPPIVLFSIPNAPVLLSSMSCSTTGTWLCSAPLPSLLPSGLPSMSPPLPLNCQCAFHPCCNCANHGCRCCLCCCCAFHRHHIAFAPSIAIAIALAIAAIAVAVAIAPSIAVTIVAIAMPLRYPLSLLLFCCRAVHCRSHLDNHCCHCHRH